VNIDENPQAAQMYGIHSIPTLLLFKDGEVAERIVGVPPKTKLTAILDSSI
jgi:thioredoxin 1